MARVRIPSPLVGEGEGYDAIPDSRCEQRTRH